METCRERFLSKPASTSVVMELAMINWPEMFRDAEDWADRFWTGAASASLMVVVGAAFVVLVGAI